MAESHFVHGKQGSTKREILSFLELQYALSNAHCNGTIPHGKALERMTNACFQTKPSSSGHCGKGPRLLQNVNQKESKKERRAAWLLQNVNKKESKGCLFASDKYPLCIPDSRKFLVKVEQRAWNCVIGNATNLLDSLGQYDSVVESALTFAQSQSQNSGCSLFKPLKGALIGAKYSVFCLPRLSFEGLSAFVVKLKLPMLVSLPINCSGVTYNHVIGICPYKVGDGSRTQY